MPQARILTYRIWLTKEPEGGYTVTVPSLPGCVTFGDSVDEAIVMAAKLLICISRVSKLMAKPFPPKKQRLSIR